MRRALAVAGGLAALAAAALLFVLALDVLRWGDHVEAADLRFAAAAGDASMWEPDTILPIGASRSLLALEDDLAHRRAVQSFRTSRVGEPARSQDDVARRGRLEAELARLDRSDENARRRARVANLQGALAFELAREDSGQSGVLLRRSIEAFRRAVRLDPAAEDAKYNLELALRLLQQAENDSAPGGGGERGDTQGSGAGAATSGSGY